MRRALLISAAALSTAFATFTGCATSPRATKAPHAWLEIDVTAFERNIATLQKELAGRSKLCAVMKADAYGHGMALLTPSVVKLNVPCVAITDNRDAETARQAGFEGTILRIRTATVEEVEEGLALEIDELIGNLEIARALDALASRQGRKLRYHLAINSAGMSRNGFELKTAQGRADALAALKLAHLELVGVMTHFPVEDKADVRKSLAAFNAEVAWLVREGALDRSKIVVNAANSFATLEVPEARLDLVRVGGALYGDTVPTRTEYQRVLAFKSRVAAVNAYPAGNTVSYDRTFKLKRDSRLANIPVGYSDGLRRVFSNQGAVLIRGRRFPIVGRVTMNTIMVDVTDAPEIARGDEAVLFGKQGSAEITQAELEKQGSTILADLYTMWGASNPRVPVRH